MDVYLNAAALARACGVSPAGFKPPPPDVTIGRYRGWHPSRVEGGTVTVDAVSPPRGALLSVSGIAAQLNLSRGWANQLCGKAGFPRPAACIADPETEHGGKAWDGALLGWDTAEVLRWAERTGRLNDGTPRKRSQGGRPKGSGDYAGLPRCGRAKTGSLRGGGQPCKAVCRKVEGVWAPACALHLNDAERAALGLTKTL